MEIVESKRGQSSYGIGDTIVNNENVYSSMGH